MSTVAFDLKLQQGFSVPHQKQFQAKEIKHREHLYEVKAKVEKWNYNKRLITVSSSLIKTCLETSSHWETSPGQQEKRYSKCQQLQNRRNCNFSCRMGSGRVRSIFQMVLSSWRHALKSTKHSAKGCLRTAVNLEKTNAQAPNGKKITSYCSFTASSIWM